MRMSPAACIRVVVVMRDGPEHPASRKPSMDMSRFLIGRIAGVSALILVAAFAFALWRAQFDVDGDSKTNALTDGLMIVRYLFGLRGAALTAGAIGAGATRNGAQIEAHIQALVQ
jgi:hypothetical protein